MALIKQTPQQRANTLEALNVMWPSVPPENVVEGLYAWRRGSDKELAPDCGTVACFGGWCAWWPAFRDQGVFANGYGVPRIGVRHYAYDVAGELFGDRRLFMLRGEHTADQGVMHDFIGTDHGLVTNRLKWLLDNSEVVS